MKTKKNKRETKIKTKEGDTKRIENKIKIKWKKSACKERKIYRTNIYQLFKQGQDYKTKKKIHRY